MTSESADGALSPAVTSLVTCGKSYWNWGHREKKIVHTFGDAFATVERVFMGNMGRGSSQKYRVKYTNISDELISEYGAIHRLVQDSSKKTTTKNAENAWSPAIISESRPSRLSRP